MFLYPKATSCPEGNVLLSVRWPWSSPLVSFMFYAGNCSDINSYNARKTFLPLLKIVYKLPSLFMNLFFCFLLSAWSCWASFCSHWAVIDGAAFLLCLGVLVCAACCLRCSWPPCCVWQLCSCWCSLRHTPPACAVGWVALHYSRGYTHAHACTQGGAYIGMG